MNSATDVWEGGLGSSSGELGHNVMDHHFRDGASGYVLKPFKADALFSKVESVLLAAEKEMLELMKESKPDATGGDQDTSG